jgi:hypothetical protein
VVKQLLRLYPARWQERYGQEMARLLEDLAPLSRGARLRITADVLLGALDAHLSREFRAAAGAARAIGLAAAAAVIGWLPLGALIFLSNVTFASQDDAISSAAGYLYLIAAFAVIGAVASRACASTGSWLAACAVAGAVMAVLVNATFAAVYNAFPGIAGKQPQKIADFRASGMTSMRDFLNLSLERQVIGITIELIVMGLFFGMLGACGAAERRQARRESSRALPAHGRRQPCHPGALREPDAARPDQPS